MSEEPQSPEDLEQQQPEPTPEDPKPQEGEPEEKFDADYVAKLRKEAAKYRTEAKENAAAAKRLQEIEESQKSELQKAIERAEAAEGIAYALQTAQQINDWKAAAAKKHGVPVDVLRGSDEDEIEEHARSLKALLPEPRKPGQVPAEGRTVPNGSGDPAQQFAEIIRSKVRGN
jgi:hypothetical protein